MNHRISLPGLICRICTVLTLCSAIAYQGYSQEAEAEESDEEIYELSPFTVSTRDDRGYLSTNAVSGTSLNTSIRDLPMALEVINQEFIEDLGALNMDEALEYSAGVETTAFELPTWSTGNAANFDDASPSGNVQAHQGNVLTIRGYRSPNQQRLGFRIGMLVPEYGIVTGGSTNTLNMQRLEVVRGPNSLLYGVNMLTGVVNIVPKTPLSEKRSSAGLTVGSNSLIRGTFDTTGPILSQDHNWGELNYRVMGSAQTNDNLKEFSKYDGTYYAGQLDYWTKNKKFNLFLEYQLADNTSQGIGPKWFTGPGGVQYFRNEYGEPIIWTRTYDPDSPDYALIAEPGSMPYEIKDYGFYQNISGPDTWYKSQEENFLALAKLNPFEGLHIEGGVYYSSNESETRDLSFKRFTPGGLGSSYFDLRFADAFPEYDPNDTLTRETADAIRLNGDPLSATLLDSYFDADTLRNLSHGGFGFSDIIAVEAPGDSSRYNPAGNSGADISRHGARYSWYQWPQTSDSIQARLRAAYDFDSDFLNSHHTFVVGVNYIEDEISFVHDPKFNFLNDAPYQEAWGDWDGVSLTPSNPRFHRDAVYYRDSVFNPNPIRFAPNTVLGVAGRPSKFRLGHGTQSDEDRDGDGAPDRRLLNWVTRSGHTDVALEFSSANALYQGRYFDDRLMLFGGVRYDEYETSEREKLRVVDWTGATGTAPGKPLSESSYPLTTHIIGDGSQPYVPIPALDIPAGGTYTGTINDAVAADFETIREVYPDGTRESQPKQTFTTPSFGVSYRVIDPLTVYFTHSEGIFPNSGQRDGNYREIDAERSKSDELGVKFDLWDSKVSGTISAFRIKRENATYRLGVAPNPAGWFGGPAHNGATYTQAFDPAVFAGLYGVPEDAEALRASWPEKWSQTISYTSRFPPRDIGTAPALVYGLLNVNLERSLEERGYTLDQIRSIKHPVTGERFTNAPSGYLGSYNQGGTYGDFFTRFITFVYLFDLDILNAPPHEDPVIEDMRNVVRAAFEDAYDGQDERLPQEAMFTGSLQRIGDIHNPSQYDGLQTSGAGNAPFVTYEEEGTGFDGQIIISPLNNYQIVFNFSRVQREIVGKGFNMVRPIDQWGNDWATGWDAWNWAFHRQNFTDPKDPTTFTGEGVNGIDISFVPQDNLALWNKYSFTDGTLDNLEIFGGVTWAGEAVTSTPLGGRQMRANYFRTPPTAERYEVGAGLGYRFELRDVRWNLRLNINNLLDDTYDANYITYNETDPFTGEPFTEKRRWERYYPGTTFRLTLMANF